MINYLLFVILCVCVLTDLKSRKIYNVVTFPAYILALVLNALLNGWSGIAFSLMGFLCGFALLLIPYLMGGMGAGDVKLLALIGALKGASFVLITSIYMAIIGGLIGLLILLFRKGVFTMLKSIFISICGIRYGLKIPIWIDKDGLQKTYPYGVAIAGGAVLTFILDGVILK
ncbi:A24 family peptidase [Litchfieldia alkalitelluris]|uniref:A24 family peptidase n=1 Tax=Litchfieldia alkalitelluris TaxID=304268 RepID=UPI000998356D|nr:prepilin peptidase [Litchfieldia alkalitelluris]